MRILIADDHELLRGSLRSLLEAKGYHVVGEAGDGQEALKLTRSLKPDVVLMDLNMPKLDGLEATRRLAEELPECRVVMLTASDEEEDLFEALKAGAQGYLVKNVPPTEFFRLLDGAARGEPALTPNLARKVLTEFARRGEEPVGGRKDPTELTERELEVLGLMASGVTSSRSLARQMGVSENTVKFHIRNILDKLQLSNRAQAVSYALRHGLVDPGKSEPPE